MTAEQNPVIETLIAHRSIRKFDDRPIEPQTLDLLLRAGVRAATAGNLQHYSLIVVEDEEVKRALWDHRQAAAPAPTAIVSVVDEYRLKRWFELNQAPFYFDHIVNLLIGYWDAIIALHNVVVAAEALGLGAFYDGTVLSKDLAQILGAPEYVCAAGLAWVGYPDETPELRPRLPLEAVVHRDRYHVPTDDEVRAWFRDKDRRWDAIPAPARQKLKARGIHNFAQARTAGHYTSEFIEGESQAILRHLQEAGFDLTGEEP